MMKKLLLTIILLVTVARPAFAQWNTATKMFSTIRERLGVAPTDTSRFPNSRLYSALNEALQAVCVDVGGYRKLDSVTTSTNTTLYTAPADAIEGWPIEILAYNAKYKTKRYIGLNVVPVENLNEENKREMATPGYVHDSTIVIYPPTPLPDGELYVFYRARHPEITVDTNSILIGPEDRRGVIHYACYLAALAQMWPEQAAAHWELYQWHVANRKAEMVKPPPLPLGP